MEYNEMRWQTCQMWVLLSACLQQQTHLRELSALIIVLSLRVQTGQKLNHEIGNMGQKINAAVFGF